MKNIKRDLESERLPRIIMKLTDPEDRALIARLILVVEAMVDALEHPGRALHVRPSMADMEKRHVS